MRKSTLLAFLVIALCIVAGILIYNHPGQAASIEPAYPTEFDHQISQAKADPVKWQEFLDCSADQGDAGCDSCFFKVFGYHTDASFYSNY